MNDDFIRRPEFELLKDHIDDQHVSLLDRNNQTEVAIMSKMDSNLKWAIGTLIGLITAMILVLYTVRDDDMNHINGTFNQHEDFIRQNIEQNLVNTQIIGAGLEKSNAKDSEIIDKIELIQEKNEIQLQGIKENVELRHPK